MAAIAEMGEVEDIISKEEGNVITNGDLSNDVDMEVNQEIQNTLKKATIPEPMDTDEHDIDTKESNKETNADKIDEETTDQLEVHDDTTNQSEEATNQSEEATNQSEETTNQSEETTNNSEGHEEQSETNEDADEEHSVTNDDAEERSETIEEVDGHSESNEEVEQQSENNEEGDEHCEANEEVKEHLETNEKPTDIIDESSQDTKASEEEDENSKSVQDESSQHSTEGSDKSSKKLADSFIKEKIVEIHEIESDDDEDTSKSNKISNSDPIELNDSGGDDEEEDVMIVENDAPKENGTEIIDLATPEKQIKEKPIQVITPRRSSRNLNKSKSYIESDKEDSDKEDKSAKTTTTDTTTTSTTVTTTSIKLPQMEEDEEESDVEEVLPQDPLACNDAITVERIPANKPKPVKATPIVVSDTKKLVEIATKSSNSIQGKKEPTLVIIDTNSILSGRGPVPVNNKSNAISSTSNYQTVLPMALPAQGMYPPNMRATITPIPVNSTTMSPAPQPKLSPATITPAMTTPLLPTLTDDMFVVEAPSFIVPYVYEKPPVKDFKDFVKDIQKQILESKEEEDKKIKEEKKADEDGNESEEDVKVDADSEKVKKEVKTDPAYVPETKKDAEEPKKPYSYFDSPLGKFFINIGFGLVQEFVQNDILKQQKRKHSREGGSNPETEKTIKTLVKSLEYSKENNRHFKTVLKKCEFCNFKTESALAMSYHLETPHMKNFVYKCNFCAYEVRSPHDILFHMEAEHAVRGHLERAPAFHQCPNCPFEDNQKGKLSRHLVTCMRKFKPERNLEPPVDWEPPAKIPRVPKMRQQGLNATAAAYQAMSKTTQYQFLSKMQLQSTQNVLNRGRGRPSLGTNMSIKSQGAMIRPPGMVFKQQAVSGGGSVLVPTNYQLSGNQVFQNQSSQQQSSKKAPQQPSISITPLPRGTTATVTPVSSGGAKPGDTTSKNSFVICEICDGYIKDLEQLRNHMQWIHKIKIHPKMIYNRPPLNCQKCQFRFFTDQGLERHLLGSHGLVTSSMQDAANKSKDSGRCPVCGRVYQWKLLNHVARDHNMTLKPAHLSYKCTVCTATFGMYKQFENHVYSAHSVVAKRVMDKKAPSSTTSSSSGKATVADQMKPLKINDEITIIPQPAKSSTNGKEEKSSPSTSKNNKTA